MLKKFVKLFVTTAMCTLLMAGTAFAATATSADYSTGSLRLDANNQPIIKETGSYNNKVNASDSWSLYVTTISTQGDYGIRFFPAKVDGSILTYCKQSGIWRKSTQTGWVDVAYQSGDARVGKYELCARRDDNAAYTGTFSATGWWSADRKTSR